MVMGVSAQGWNVRRKGREHVFQGRYKAIVVYGEGKGGCFRIVAWFARNNTGVSNELAAKRLEMGHPLSVNRPLKEVEKSRNLRKRTLEVVK